MLTVTAQAAEKLREAVQAQTSDPEMAIRLVRDPLMPNRLNMEFDTVRENDQVIESAGTKVLLVDPELAAALDGMVIDCYETPMGTRFTISEVGPTEQQG